MKYESSILKRLIDTYGVIGNPRYLSEIIKEFIVRGKELYPQLFTYQSDWLAHIDEFGLTPEYTVSYTGQHIYAPNTKEKPVKSAILKGSTKYRDIDTGEVLDTFDEGRNLELVSVKMPVLTTTGKNLFDVRSIDNAEYDGVYRYVKIPIKRNTTYTFSLDKTLCFGYVNIAYRTTPFGGGELYWVCHPSFPRKDVFTFTNTIYDFLYINWNENNEDLPREKYMGLFRTFQFEEGSTATPYEPYKTNILSTSEDVELRGIGDVKDELDCLTGKVTQYINEIVLNGSENWVDRKTDTETHKLYYLRDLSIKANTPFICDKLANSYATDTNGIFSNGWDGHYFFIRLDKSIVNDVSELKAYLQSNPITVQYQLETESIKTVALTIHDKDHQKVERLTTFEGGTHFTTSSQDGSLLPTLTVDVVTDLEKTMMVCSLEGNTM